MKLTLSRKEASVFVDGNLEVSFKTKQSGDDIITGISQAESFVNTNQSDLVGKTVEIFVKHKEYKLEVVETVKMEEV